MAKNTDITKLLVIKLFGKHS